MRNMGPQQNHETRFGIHRPQRRGKKNTVNKRYLTLGPQVRGVWSLGDQLRSAFRVKVNAPSVAYASTASFSSLTVLKVPKAALVSMVRVMVN